MTFLEYHVEYCNRETEREHHRQLGTYKAACDYARRQSDRHGFSSVVVYENSGPTPTEGTLTLVGEVVYAHGLRDTVEGRVK